MILLAARCGTHRARRRDKGPLPLRFQRLLGPLARAPYEGPADRVLNLQIAEDQTNRRVGLIPDRPLAHHDTALPDTLESASSDRGKNVMASERTGAGGATGASARQST